MAMGASLWLFFFESGVRCNRPLPRYVRIMVWTILFGTVFGIIFGTVLARRFTGLRCTVVSGSSLTTAFRVVLGLAITVGVALIAGMVWMYVELYRTAAFSELAGKRLTLEILGGAILLLYGFILYLVFKQYQKRDRYILIRNARRTDIEPVLLAQLKAYGLTQIPRLRLYYEQHWNLPGVQVRTMALFSICLLEVSGENAALCAEVQTKLLTALEAYAEAAPARQPFQFSLRSALLTVLLIGSAATLHWHWEPWVRQYEFRNDYDAGSVALSADGKTVATSSNLMPSYLRTVDTGAVLLKLRPPAIFHRMEFDPGSRLLLTQGVDRTIRVLDAHSGAEQFVIKDTKDGAGFSPDGTKVLIWSNTRGIAKIFNASTGEQITEIGHGRTWVRALFSPDSKSVITAGDDNIMHVWRVRDAVRDRDLEIKIDGLPVLNFSPDGKLLLAFTPSGTAYMWEYATGKCVYTFSQANLEEAVFAPDSRYLLTRSQRGWPVWIWDTTTGNCIRTLTGDGDSPTSIGWSPDSRQIIVGSGSDVEIWDAVSFARTSRIPQIGNGNITLAAFCPDNRRVVVGGSRLALWVPRRTDGPYGVLALPELWTTILLAIGMLVSLWKDQRKR